MQTQLLNQRKSIRLLDYDYSQNGMYFVTICAKNRECIFCKIINYEIILSEIGQIVNNCWTGIPQHFSQASLHEFVIMPDHIHGIIEINVVGANHYSPLTNHYSPTMNHHSPSTNHNSPFNNSKRANNDLPQHGTSQTIGSIVRGFKIGVTKQIGFSPWQRNYYEHIIRSEIEYLKIANYIIENPLKWNDNVNMIAK